MLVFDEVLGLAQAFADSAGEVLLSITALIISDISHIKVSGVLRYVTRSRNSDL